MALLRRGAAMTRAVVPDPSARAERLLASHTDRALSHWVELRRSMGGGDDGDADTGTDTTTPQDDREDIASLTKQSTSLQVSNFLSCPLAPFGAACSLMYQHVLEHEALFEDHGVCSGVITGSLALERVVDERRALGLHFKSLT